MLKFLVTIVMWDGSRGRHHGLYHDSCSAVIRAMDLFPGAKCISVRRIL